MTEAVFGIIGVLVGSGISWFQTYCVSTRDDNKKAKYLAIRVVCVLDKYLEDCADVVNDDGLSYGQRTEEGYLQAQVKRPPAPVFPEDVDWKSIDHELMYKILSLPSDIISKDKLIDFTWQIASPPNFEEWFEERRLHYSQFGLTAHDLAEELCRKYKIKNKTYNEWNPVTTLRDELAKAKERQKKELRNIKNIVSEVYDNK